MLSNNAVCNHVFIGCDKPQVLVWMIVRYKYCKLYVKKESSCNSQLRTYLERGRSRGRESLTSGGSGGILSQRKTAETHGEREEQKLQLMSTRSGRQYKDDPRAEALAEEGETHESGGGGPGMVPEGGHEDGALVTMFRMMQAQQEQQQRWHERAQEQQQRMMEMQMNALRSVLERGAEREAEGARRPRERAGEAAEQIKLTRLSEADGVVAYLTTFDRMMRLGHADEDLWTLRLAPQLTGKAQQAYAALNATDASQYGKVKEVILRQYNISEETYRQRFRNERRKTTLLGAGGPAARSGQQVDSGVQHGGGGGGEARCRVAGNHNARGPAHLAGGEEANDWSISRETG